MAAKQFTKKNPKIEEDNYPDYEPEEDEMGRRQIIAEDGESFTIVQLQRFALWEIKRDNVGGPLPEALKGSFTSVHSAELAIKVYLGQKAEKAGK